MTARITFAGNPWPGGHALASLEWTAHLDPGAVELGFRFDVGSADYEAEDPNWVNEEGEGDEGPEKVPGLRDWRSKGVWCNYHAFGMDGGFTAAVPGRPLSLRAPLEFDVDQQPPRDTDGNVDPDRLAFHAYVLGHDSVAHHRVRLTPDGPGGHALRWDGRIALTYAYRDAAFDYAFHLTAPTVRLGHITVPEGLGPADARSLLRAVLIEADDFAWTDGPGGRHRFVRG